MAGKENALCGCANIEIDGLKSELVARRLISTPFNLRTCEQSHVLLYKLG